jgi:hypothetical protein
MPTWGTVSPTQKTITVTAFTALAALLLYLLFGIAKAKDPPIIVGDGSITFHADTIKKNPGNELEVVKFLHKVKSLVVVDTKDGTTSTPIRLKGMDWTLTSMSGAVVLSNDPQLAGAQEGVKGDCPRDWQGSGMDYTCTPTDGSQLTPATLKITGENCPTTNQPTCTLTCPSGKCQIQLAYKYPLSQ